MRNACGWDISEFVRFKAGGIYGKHCAVRCYKPRGWPKHVGVHCICKLILIYEYLCEFVGTIIVWVIVKPWVLWWFENSFSLATVRYFLRKENGLIRSQYSLCVCVCVWGGRETFPICEYSCVNVVQYYSGFVLNCCRTRPELVWKLSISYQRPHVFVTFDMPVDYGLSMFLFRALPRPPPVVLSSTTTLLKQKLHVSSSSISISHFNALK
jgi:hypothetical protein